MNYEVCLSMFKDNLLYLNQVENLSNSELRVRISVCGSLCENMVVSSAKKMQVKNGEALVNVVNVNEK